MRKYIIVVILTLMLLPLKPTLPAVRAEVGPSAAFGYYIEKEASASTWIELDGDPTATILFSNGQDDNLSDPINLLFTFPYFEFQYTSARISTNGFLSFDPVLANPYWNNSQLPMDAVPNNIIAVFWDDLKLSTSPIGKIMAKTVTTSGKKFIVEWVNVTRLGSNMLLKFQVILYENGKIELIYKDINGDVTQNTIGIEDSDGVDGIEALYNGVGYAGIITPNTTLRFNFPPDSRRVKTFPSFQSNFVERKEVFFQLFVRNTSAASFPSDSYNLSHNKLEGDTGWTVKFLDAQTQAEITSTGFVSRGSTKPILVKIVPKSGASSGSYVKEEVKFESAGDSTKSFSVILQATIAVPFMQTFSDFVYRINLNAITPKEQLVRRVSDSYDYGKSLTISQIDENDFWYITTWQEISNEISSIHYIRSHAIWGTSDQVFQLTNNLGQPNSPRDKDPGTAVVRPQGITGFVFLRELTDSTNKKNFNIYFSRVASNGDKLGSIINITNNSAFGYGNTPNIHFYRTPRIAAIANLYSIVWEDYWIDAADFSYSDIYFTAYSSTGSQPKAPTPLTASDQYIGYKDPSILAFGTDKIFVTYFSRNSNPSVPANERDVLWLQIRDINGNSIPSLPNPIRIGYYNGQSVDMVQLGDRMVVAWLNNATSRINYVLLNGNGAVQGGVEELVSPDKRNITNFSTTKDPSGTKAIFTWENEQADRLYYALINVSGVVTPPMIFRQGEGTNPVIRTGAPGSSNAPMKDFTLSKIFLPLLRK